MEIIPSIASANQMYIGEELRRLEKGGAKEIHIDIEDGNFIPNITFGLKTIRQMREITSLPFSVHLMVTNPYEYIQPLKDIGVDSISFHIEACNYPRDLIYRIKNSGIKVGIALNPRTTFNGIEYVFGILDCILIMTAEPDTQNQLFIPEMVDKIRYVSSKLGKKGIVYADGGISCGELSMLHEAGVNKVIMGREIFSTGDSSKRLMEISGR